MDRELKRYGRLVRSQHIQKVRLCYGHLKQTQLLSLLNFLQISLSLISRFRIHPLKK